MVGILCICGAIASMVLSDMAKKLFKKDCPIFFAFISCVFAELVFVAASGFKFDFNVAVVPYAVAFACCYAPATLSFVYAYRSGSFSFTGLVISYSLLLPTLYGIIFLKEQTTWCFYVGLSLLCVAIYLITVKKKSKDEENNETKNGFTLKWLIFVIVAFIANGLCSIVQTTEQIKLDGLYKSELMIIGLSISAIVFLTVSLILERKKVKEGATQALKFGCLSGILNGLLNLCILYAVNYVSSSIVFPLVAGGSLMFTFIVARLCFKEKYSILQYVGFGVSVISVILLNM